MSTEIGTALRYDEDKIDPLNLHPQVQEEIAKTANMLEEWVTMADWFYGRRPPSAPVIPLFKKSDKVLKFGRTKYSSLNYTKGMLYSRVMRSFLRHMIEAAEGNALDSESDLPHADHAACNMLFALTYSIMGYDGTEIDDRKQFSLETLE